MMHQFRSLLLTTVALTALASGAARANPDGPNVVGGAATVGGLGTSTVIVNQHTDRAIIDWRTFNIGNGELTRFNQPNSGSVVLNRVTGGLGPSQILGTLSANGKVFLVNPDGILFGPNSIVNTAGFLATTSGIKNDDFMAGRYVFDRPGRPDASIVNLGTITATDSGFAALVAPGVRNSGTITANVGSVGLASGNGFTLDFYGDKLITLQVGDQIAASVKDVATGETLDALVKNTGKLSANGGRVELSAVTARQVVDSVINNTGVIEANTVGQKGGQIILGAATASTKVAGAPAQNVKVSGTLSAAGKDAGTKGGKVKITGESITLTGANIDASGKAGGGKVLIGGDVGGGKGNALVPQAMLENEAISNATTLTADAMTVINASAKRQGDGGKVVLWSNGATTFYGTILATGGRKGGNGGFVETSGKFLNVGGSKVSAGQGGTWLLDPDDLLIDASLAATIETSLNSGTNVFKQTSFGGIGGSGDITVAASIHWTTSAMLTLSAYRHIIFDGSGAISNTGGGKLVMRADNTGTGTGTVTLNTTGQVNFSTGGAVSIFYNPTSYAAPTSYGTSVISPDFTAYMLVNNVTNLQAIATNVNGAYALGRDIDATGFANPIGSSYTYSQFNGVFDGQFHTIDNLTLHLSASNAGLFGYIGANGRVQNLFLEHVSVATGQSNGKAGALAATNEGTISNVHVVSGTVGSGATAGAMVGGLVGENLANGFIQYSSSSANVSASAATSGLSSMAGGLVGLNAGTIQYSYATGNVSGQGALSTYPIFAYLGGLVGMNTNNGTITGGGAEGNVIATGAGAYVMAGGLVGVNISTAANSILGSSASGNVSVKHGSNAGGLVGFNSGEILGGYAEGNVIGTASFGPGSSGVDRLAIGGLVGANGWMVSGPTTYTGKITLSQALGNVTVNGTDTGSVCCNATAGGLVGTNVGDVLHSQAFGNVLSTVDHASLGGLVGTNSGSITDFGILSILGSGFASAHGNVTGAGRSNIGGLVGTNETGGTIFGAVAIGNVVGGPNSAAGGLVGANQGSVTQSSAWGNLLASNNSMVGGLVGSNGPDGTITISYASGVVIGGDQSYVGGLVGGNVGEISVSFAAGDVYGGQGSKVGGLVGVNGGLSYGALTPPSSISKAYATGAVHGDSGSAVGGLVGVNGGTIDQTYAVGAVTAAPGSVKGGLVAENLLTGTPPGWINAIGLSFGTTLTLSNTAGTTTSSYWNTETTGQSVSAGGDPKTTAQLIAGLPPGFSTTDWTIDPGPPTSYPYLTAVPYAKPSPNGYIDPTEKDFLNGIVNLIDDLLQHVAILDAKTDNPGTVIEIVNNDPAGTPNTNTPGTNRPGRPGDPATTAGIRGLNRPPLDKLPSGVPPITETRYVSNEVTLEIEQTVPRDRVEAIARQLGLNVLGAQDFNMAGTSMFRFRLPAGRTVADVIRAMEAGGNKVGAAQPNYVYSLTQGTAPDLSSAQDLSSSQDLSADPASRATGVASPSSLQYSLSKLRLTEAHRVSRGEQIVVAVIDSEVDRTHPDLKTVKFEAFDALGDNMAEPHAHGTSMTGAIASRGRILGVAPGVDVLAIKAFGSAGGNTFEIIKGLDWAAAHGAKIVNMSFAGPPDPMLSRALAVARRKGMVLIAAAGNAGPKSPPLFPAADPNVIAVTATDLDDKVFPGANRGKYIAVAAPGVDVLALSPGGRYEMSTGTSIATAHVSGLAALLLQRNPTLGHEGVRRILMSTAKDLGPKGHDAEYGAGLVDAYGALNAAASEAPDITSSIRPRL
jgi:filamentous hemagglutinin family protein